jgi:hypothetical protein
VQVADCLLHVVHCMASMRCLQHVQRCCLIKQLLLRPSYIHTVISPIQAHDIRLTPLKHWTVVYLRTFHQAVCPTELCRRKLASSFGFCKCCLSAPCASAGLAHVSCSVVCAISSSSVLRLHCQSRGACWAGLQRPLWERIDQCGFLYSPGSKAWLLQHRQAGAPAAAVSGKASVFA